MQINVALVYTSFLHIGGVEAHLLSLLRHSDPSRHRWLIVAPTHPDFQAQADALGAQVIPWKPAHLFDAVSFGRLVSILKHSRADIVHVHSPRASLFGRIAARLIGRPAVVTVHLPPYYYAGGPGLGSRFRRWAYCRMERILNDRFTDRLIYVSSRVCQEAIALGIAPSNRTVVIENGIDLKPYAETSSGQAVRQALGTPQEATVLCCVGRLSGQKGFDVLLETISMLKSGSQAWRVWLIGDGPERGTLEAQAHRLGLEERVQFLGFRSDVPDLLRASDIFVLPSRYEAMSIALLEGMAAGRPCVVTDVGDNAELIQDGVSGRVVPAENVQALAGALDELLSSPSLRREMGQAAKNKVQRYDVKRMVDRTLAVYEQVLSKRRGPFSIAGLLQ